MNYDPPEIGSYEHRFSGIQRLYGYDSSILLKSAHFVVIGLGGVGSWAAEAIARSGIGEITIIDWDDICLSNTNRQIHALSNAAGKSKANLLCQRIQLINPECKVNAIREYYCPENADDLVHLDIDYIIDAIDNKNTKIHLINHSKKIGVPIITCGGAGGRINPSNIKISDLGESKNDPLLAQMRKQLRKDFNLPREKKVKFNIPCVYSDESMRYPDDGGNICFQKPAKPNGPKKLDCAMGFGSVTHITGSIGFAMSGYAINDYLYKNLK